MKLDILICVVFVCASTSATLWCNKSLKTSLPQVIEHGNINDSMTEDVFDGFFQGSLSKREEFDHLDWFSTPGQILKARFTITEAAAKRLFVGDTWKTVGGATHLPHLKGYFEQLLFERWLTVLDDYPELESLDEQITTIWEYIHPMYRQKAVHKPQEMTEMMQIAVKEYTQTLNSFCVAFSYCLHNKNQHYRDLELEGLTKAFYNSVDKYRGLPFAVTPQTRNIDMLIQAMCDLADWAGREYTQARNISYSNVQNALASRLQERLRTIKMALLVIEKNKDMEQFSRLVLKVHQWTFYFYSLNFPTNETTYQIIELFEQIFRLMALFEFVGPEKPTLVPFERFRSWRMRTKLEATRNYLSRLGGQSLFPPEMYWKLLQVKVDVRKWVFEIKGWGENNATEIKGLQIICDDVIKETNRLKRTMDRLPIPEIL